MKKNRFSSSLSLLLLSTALLLWPLGGYAFEPEPIEIEVSGKLALCSYAEKGHINLTVTGGTAPYQFEWPSIKQYTPNIDNLNPGKYTVLVTDSEGTRVEKEILIQPPYPLIAKMEQLQPASCGQGNGAAAVKIQMGRGEPYRIEWSHGLKNEKKAENLSPGIYHVEIFDKYNCSTTLSFEIKTSGSPIAVEENIQNNYCGSTDQGKITLEVSGGEAPYQFLWSNGATNHQIDQLPSGAYSVDISDASGCMITKTFEVKSVEPLEVSAKTRELNCFGAENGNISLEVQGGEAPFTISWTDNAAEDQWERSQLKAGQYTAIIKDANGCSTEKTITLTQPQQMRVQLNSGIDVDCATSTAEGTAWVSIDGGTAPYRISWSTGTMNAREIKFTQSQEISVTVEDAKGCMAQQALKVNFPSSMSRVKFSYHFDGFTTSEDIKVRQPVYFESNVTDEVIAYEWDFGDGHSSQDSHPEHTYERKGDFKVSLRVYDIYGCSAVESNTIKVEDNSPIIKVPNAFSPNGDGLNDTFMPKFKNLSHFEMAIFNTWGELMYQVEGMETQGWDGTYKGVRLPPGNYVYKISYTDLDSNAFDESGVFTLIK